jgi:dipeptidyl aminopeptidase/acylaminoacyl peptidase
LRSGASSGSIAGNEVKPNALILCLFLLAGFSGWAQQKYLPPPDAAKELFASRPMPRVSLSPDQRFLLIAEGQRFRRIGDLAARVVALAGVRVSPFNNGPAAPSYFVRMEIKVVATGKKFAVKLPPGARRFSLPVWSPDGRRFAFLQYNHTEVSLWVGEAATRKVKQVPNLKINASLGRSFQWLTESDSLLCLALPKQREKAPIAPRAPAGPVVQETGPKESAVLTYPDLLQNEHDEKLFDYYLTAQLTLVDVRKMSGTPLGRPSIFARFDVSPDGRYVLVERVHPPYSYQAPIQFFPRSIEVWDPKAKVEAVHIRPATENVGPGGVPVQPRGHHWRPTGPPATIVWVEALDGGDPKREVEYRDRVMMLEAPFHGEPIEVTKLENRFSQILWGETRGVALVREYESERKWYQTWLVNPENPDIPDRLLWSHSVSERYQHPGYPLMRQLANGKRAMRVFQQSIFLNGNGSSPEGDRPFLDRLDLVKFERHTLFKCAPDAYEAVVALMSDDGLEFVTRHETESEHPNYFVRNFGEPERKPLTQFEDPAKSLREVKKKLITYEREDGVKLNCMLHLPPDYDLENPKPLPTILWAYPRAYTEGTVAGQVANSPHRFSTFAGASPRFLALEGYAVLDQVAMPIVGGENANDNFAEQIVANAEAAITAVVELGVCDRERVGVGGHSYGAFMAVMLLANSDIFRAGVARSGAYNRTLTPFGFQNERRTLWQAPQTYLEMSPLLAVPKIRDPLLLIHGDKDKNIATNPDQTKRLFHAIKGNGGKARIVMLPHESHTYQARESVGHTLAEMVNWFDKHVKGEPDETGTGSGN